MSVVGVVLVVLEVGVDAGSGDGNGTDTMTPRCINIVCLFYFGILYPLCHIISACERRNKRPSAYKCRYLVRDILEGKIL